MATQYEWKDPSGITRLEGTLTPDPAENPATAYVTVQTHAPSGPFQTPLVFDSTASTGGLYAWTGSAYHKVGLATS